MAGSHTTDALVLRSADYRDADRVLTLFTKELGKVGAIARGARASRRRFAGTLEPYAVLRVELAPARGELMTLRQAEVVRVFSGILGDLSRMEVAGAALGLVREACPCCVPDGMTFLHVLQFLALLDHRGDPHGGSLLVFALRVLALSGLSPRLDVCARSAEPVPDGRPSYFDPAVGGVVARRHGGGPYLLNHAARTKLLESQGEQWLDVARQPWEPDDLRVARAAMGAFIAAHLDAGLARRLFGA